MLLWTQLEIKKLIQQCEAPRWSVTSGVTRQLLHLSLGRRVTDPAGAAQYRYGSPIFY